MIANWPFSTVDMPEIKQDAKGMFVELNNEEKQDIKDILDILRGRTNESEYAWREDVIDEVVGLAESRGLKISAMRAVDEFKDSGNKDALHRALASVFKAYVSCSLPIYIYDYASLLVLDGRIDEAQIGFSAFIEQQTTFKPNEYQEVLLGQRDIAAAIKDAKARI